MNELVDLTIDTDVGLVTINNPPVNALSPGVPEGILSAIEKCTDDPAVKGLVLIGGGRTFIAGADINEFEKMASGVSSVSVALMKMFSAIDSCSKPIVAAIHGTAFGGGLEAALCCHYRVAIATAQVGQPEVKLGLIPGAGGTQRMPRLVGMAKAMEICAGGEPIPASEAFRLGVLDQIIDGDLLTGAIAFTREIIAKGGKVRRTSTLPVVSSDADELLVVKNAIAKRSRGMIAPQKAIEAVEASSLPFEEGMRNEAELFKECLTSTQSKALIHAFFGEREVSRVPGIPKETPKLPIRSAAVVGAGTMGGGIAMNYANAGIPVLLKETDQAALDRGIATIRKNYATSVQKGKLTESQMIQRVELIQPTLDYDRFKEVDIVVEAVFEGMDLKKKIFAELDKVTKPDVVLASNTSTLDIDEIASATSKPEQVIGHHFFSPANVMKLMEVVRGNHSSPQTIATSMALAKTLGKVGVLVGNCNGFVGNRMFGPYQREAQFLVEEGASIEEVDAALVEFGMVMGPFAVADLAGIDVAWRILNEYQDLIPSGTRKPLVLNSLYEQGRYGQKTNAGWYDYSAGNRTPVPSADVQRLIEEKAVQAGIRRREIARHEIVERIVYALINEGAKILDEGIALRPVDIDIIYIYGYGFPAFRGGPMWYADTVGLDKVCDRIEQFERQHGSIWTPSTLIKNLADSGKKFADFGKERSVNS